MEVTGDRGIVLRLLWPSAKVLHLGIAPQGHTYVELSTLNAIFPKEV
jgi:hypothetical protein